MTNALKPSIVISKYPRGERLAIVGAVLSVVLLLLLILLLLCLLNSGEMIVTCSVVAGWGYNKRRDKCIREHQLAVGKATDLKQLGRHSTTVVVVLLFDRYSRTKTRESRNKKLNY